MAQVNFNDKQSGDQLTANDVNSLKSTINDNEGLLSNGTVSGYYDSSNQFRYNHHIIPASNGNFDLGNAEYKVRHLYLTSNSLWMGDDVKIDVSTNGTVQTKKRDKSKLPYYITGAAGLDATENEILDYFSKSNVSELTLSDLEKYAKSINSDATVSDIFPAEDSENYQESDFETKTSINQNKNQRKKIYIKFDMAPSVPTLDLNKHTDFELYIDSESVNYFANSNWGEIPVKLIPSEHRLSKFNIFISQPANSSDYNWELFHGESLFTPRIAFSNNVGTVKFKNLDQLYTSRDITSTDDVVHFECIHVKSTDVIIPESINALEADPSHVTYIHKMTVNEIDYYWGTDNQALEGLTTPDVESIKPDASQGDYKLNLKIENGEEF